MLNRIKNEPILLTTLVSALCVLGVQLGLPISDGLANAASAVIIAGAALFGRSRVSPVAGDAGEDGLADGEVILLVAILLGVVLLLFGVSFK